MTVKDIQNILASSMDAKVFICRNKQEALDEISIGGFSFNEYTELEDYRADMKVVYVYTSKREQLEVWVVKED